MATDIDNATLGVGVSKNSLLLPDGRRIIVGHAGDEIRDVLTFLDSFYVLKGMGLYAVSQKDLWITCLMLFENARVMNFLDVGEGWLRFQIGDKTYILTEKDGITTVTQE